jgi:hypothetical protein
MLPAAKRVEAAESAAAALQDELAAKISPLAPPDPSSTLALPPASNLELRVYESLGLDAAIGKSCVQQQKQLAATAPARRRAKPAAAHKPSQSKPRDAATRDDMATLRLAERELQAARRREATAARDRDALADQLEAARAKARANALEKAAMPRVPERPRARRVEAVEAPAKLSTAQAQALDLRMRREMAALRVGGPPPPRANAASKPRYLYTLDAHEFAEVVSL